MKVPANQIDRQLKQKLAPVYLISGDEPLQRMEVAAAVKTAAEAQGYSERIIMHVEPGFEWSSLQGEACAMSLFAERRIIDVRMSSPKPGREGGKVLRDYAANPPEDTILLLQMGRFEKGGANAAWVKALDKVGIFCQIWDLKPAETVRWVATRLRAAGFQPEQDAVNFLTEQIEGNLLAAAQEIDKLTLLYEPGALDFESVKAAVVDSSRFDIFELSDAALSGDSKRAVRILRAVEEEGIASAQVSWALSRDIRLLSQISDATEKGVSSEAALKGLWQSRREQLTQASRRFSRQEWSDMLMQCVGLDEIIKGRRKGNAWDELLQLTLWLSGKKLWA